MATPSLLVQIVNGFLQVVDQSQTPAFVKASIALPNPNSSLIFCSYYPDYVLSASSPTAIPGLTTTLDAVVFVNNVGATSGGGVGVYDSTGATEFAEIDPGGFILLFRSTNQTSIGEWKIARTGSGGVANLEILVANIKSI